jgi:phage tail-like protein
VNGTITMFNEKGEAKAKFEFINAWPCAIIGPTLGADSNEIGIEEITITHEGYKRVKV